MEDYLQSGKANSQEYLRLKEKTQKETTAEEERPPQHQDSQLIWGGVITTHQTAGSPGLEPAHCHWASRKHPSRVPVHRKPWLGPMLHRGIGGESPGSWKPPPGLESQNNPCRWAEKCERDWQTEITPLWGVGWSRLGSWLLECLRDPPGTSLEGCRWNSGGNCPLGCHRNSKGGQHHQMLPTCAAANATGRTKTSEKHQNKEGLPLPSAAGH